MRTPRQSQKNIQDIDFSVIPQWPDNIIADAFKKIRDTRFLIQEASPEIKRRIPWLYVENGCFARAALIRQLLNKSNLPEIKKIFIFGNMKFTMWHHEKLVQTITFKDHVAPAFRLKDETYIIDPPLNFQRPLKLNEWVDQLFVESKDTDFKLCIASQFTLSHNSSINAKSAEDEVGMRDHIMRDLNFFTQDFLKREYDFISKRGVDFKETLGPSPFFVL